MYLTYEAYQNMGGTLDETTFTNYEYEAETIVNWYTFNRLKEDEPKDYPSELPRCMNSLIELIKLWHDAMILGKQTMTVVTTEGSSTSVETVQVSGPIKSQSNDGVSVSYNVVDANDLVGKLSSLNKDNPFASIVFRYLQGTRNSKGKRLLYRGLYPDE